MGVGNHAEWNSKGLEEMLGSAKALQRKNGEGKEILVGHSRPLIFYRSLKFLRSKIFHHYPSRQSASVPNLGKNDMISALPQHLGRICFDGGARREVAARGCCQREQHDGHDDRFRLPHRRRAQPLL